MILNVPTAEELTEVALRLYFSAWGMLADISNEFENLDATDQVILYDDEDGGEEAMKADYKKQSQHDLQTICTLLQQANEIALKAEICKVSPYLLLVNSDMKFRASNTEVEFSELRTIDAVDLPQAVANMANKKLSDDFVRQYNQLRSLRNGLVHLGRSTQSLDPQQLLDIAIAQYVELWGDRSWLADRLEAFENSRQSFFHDYKYMSPHMLAMQEWINVKDLFKKSQYKKIFKHEKNKRRYLCLPCVNAAATRYSSFSNEDAGTAYLNPDDNTVTCLMCNETHPVKREKCDCDGCKGNVVSIDERYEDVCHTCGEGPVTLGRR